MPVSLKVEFYAVCKNSAFRSGLNLECIREIFHQNKGR